MKSIKLEGSMVALVTPFRDGKVDEVGLRNLVEFHLQNGTSAIVPCGTTGESATLSHGEHERVVDIVVQQSAGRIPVIAGTGSNCTAEAIRMTQHAERVGANGALLISPYYNRPTQEGIYLHYRAVSEAADIPLIVYSIQSRTGVNIEPETVARLAELDNIVAVKEASGNLDQMSRIIHLTGGKIVLLSGDDSLTLPVLAIGGKGVISVLANIMPRQVAELVKCFANQEIAKAREVHYKLLALTKALFLETNPAPVKEAMAWLGMVSPDLRLPLCRISTNNAERLRKEMVAVGLL